MDGHHTANVDHVRLELLGFSYVHSVVCVFLLHSHCAPINLDVESVSKGGVIVHPLAVQTYAYGLANRRMVSWGSLMT